MDEVQGTHSPPKPQGHTDEHHPGGCDTEVAQVLGTLCPGSPQGGSGHLCPHDCPARWGCQQGSTPWWGHHRAPVSPAGQGGCLGGVRGCERPVNKQLWSP